MVENVLHPAAQGEPLTKKIGAGERDVDEFVAVDGAVGGVPMADVKQSAGCCQFRQRLPENSQVAERNVVVAEYTIIDPRMKEGQPGDYMGVTINMGEFQGPDLLKIEIIVDMNNRIDMSTCNINGYSSWNPWTAQYLFHR